MPIGNWNLQWLNHNAQRAYPLTERATKTDNSGTITLPDSFIVGLYFPVHSGMSFTANNFYVKSLLISPTGFNITIGYSDGVSASDVASANIPRSSYVPNRAYAIGGIDEFSDSIGNVVLGQLDEIDLLPAGYYEFDKSGTELEPDVVRPMLRGVTRLLVNNNGELSAPIYGDVTLVAGANMRIDVSTGETGTEITFNAISGANLDQNCDCDIPDTGACIQCINGVCSQDGNFTFAQDSCIEITPLANNAGLSFTDTCAKPCCGCNELDAITAQINRFGDGVTTLQNFVTRLGSEVTQMSLVVLGSKFATGSTSCTAG